MTTTGQTSPVMSIFTCSRRPLNGVADIVRLIVRRRALLFSAVAVSTLLQGRAGATVVDVTSSTSNWTAVVYSNNNPDPSNDQQTGSSEGDIVGNAAHPSLYTAFGDAGTPSLTDGTLGFRVRVGADQSPAGFKTAFFVGIDANNDGAIDLFIGVNNSGSSDTVGIWNPGSGTNISPNTTTIVSTPLVSYTPVPGGNYHWTAVNSTIDPTVGTATDINGDGKNDYFLTLSVPFADVVAQLAGRGISGINQNSSFNYVAATATQANSLNQDLNGVDKTYDPNATWSALGAMSVTMSASGAIVVVPEPVTFGSLTAVILLIAGHEWLRRRRRRCGLYTGGT